MTKLNTFSLGLIRIALRRKTPLFRSGFPYLIVPEENVVKVFARLIGSFVVGRRLVVERIDYSDIAGIKADFIWNNKRIRPVNGENVYLGSNRVALWESTLGDAGKLVYEYTAPNSVGWYILIPAISE